MRQKQKRLFQLPLMIVSFDPCFWSKTLRQARKIEHNCRASKLQNSFFRTRPFVSGQSLGFQIAFSFH